MPVRDLDTFLGLCDPFAALSHGSMAVFVILSAFFLLRRAGGAPQRLAAIWAFVVGTGAIFCFSATYHALPYGDPLKATYWRLDHASIWIGLACIHTPVQILCGRPETHRARLSVMWTLALTGCCLEFNALDDLPAYVSPLLYIAMGWACFPILWAAYKGPGRRFFWPLFLAGSSATLGGLADATQRPSLFPGVFEAHEITHVMTSLGGVVYWWAAWSLAPGTYEQPQSSAHAPERALESSDLAAA